MKSRFSVAITTLGRWCAGAQRDVYGAATSFRPRRREPTCRETGARFTPARILAVASFLAAAGCATTPGAQPQDMSAEMHEREAQAHKTESRAHADRFDANDRCFTEPGLARGACWSPVQNPTELHTRVAARHARAASAHQAAAQALRDAEANACAGIGPEDRAISPFERTADLASVEPLWPPGTNAATKLPDERALGAVVTFRAVPGMTAEWLQRTVDCHLARNAALGHDLPEMENCPLVPKGVQARVISAGEAFAVQIEAQDPATAREVLERARRALAAGAGQ